MLVNRSLPQVNAVIVEANTENGIRVLLALIAAIKIVCKHNTTV